MTDHETSQGDLKFLNIIKSLKRLAVLFFLLAPSLVQFKTLPQRTVPPEKNTKNSFMRPWRAPVFHRGTT